MNTQQTIPPSNYYNVDTVRLTSEELLILKNLKDSWDSFLSLKNNSLDDIDDFRQAVHNCQRIIGLRVARRVNPEIWTQHK